MKDLAETVAFIVLVLALAFIVDPQQLGASVEAFLCGFHGNCPK